MQYEVNDAAQAAFFMQSASFLAGQRQLQQTKGKSNAKTIFKMERIPTDTHIRNLLDPVRPSELSEEFTILLDEMAESGYLKVWRVLGGRLAFSLDGVYYFSSQKISCAQCQRRDLGEGNEVYLHSAITPVVVAPNYGHVLPYTPEFIVPQDGTEKQDCEINAAKRWGQREQATLQRYQAVLLGDDLYSKQPLCEDALLVNWYDLVITHEETGEILYRNEWVTSLHLDQTNTPEVVACGRARWKSENENNNVLKNHGYLISHNFGHGQQHLTTTLLTLNLFAFLLHTIAQVADEIYQQIRQALGPRRTFFNDVQALMRYWTFSDWQALLNFMLVQLELEPD